MHAFELHCARLFDGWRQHSQQRLSVAAGRIAGLDAARAPAGACCIPGQFLVSPGMIDVQVNGGGGVLFNDTPSVDGVRQLARAHALHGTTALLPTLITDDLAKVELAIDAVRQCIAQQMPGVLGIHLEGPFLSPQRKGIHQPRYMLEAADLNVAQLTALGAAGRTLITLAPERVSAVQISALTEAGALVFAGHTECDDATFDAAVAAGLCGVTHLFNAMSQLGPRQAGVVGATLLDPQLWAGVILDGHHVGARSFELVKRMGRLERTFWVSDAMPPAASAMTAFTLQGQEIFVRDGRCVNDQGVLAGASITLGDCVRLGVHSYDLSLEQALAGATRIPATFLGIQDRKGGVHAGADADLVVWDAQLAIAGVMQAGAWIFMREDLRACIGDTRIDGVQA